MQPGLSEKAMKSRQRNFNLLRLRGMYYMGALLLPNDGEALKAMVERAITALGGEPEGERMAKRRLERYG